MAGDANQWRYDLRPATPTDTEFIYAVRKAGLRQYVERVWGWDETYQATQFRDSFDPARYRVVIVDGQDVGVLSVEWRPKAVFLADIEIVPEWRGRGLGTTILNELIKQADRRGLPVALQVLRVNPSRRLYERIGFRVVGETVTHFLMRTDVPRGRGESADGDQ